MPRGMRKYLLFSLLCVAVLGACRGTTLNQKDLTITVEVDGGRLVYRYNKLVSVGQFLDEIGVTLGEYDEVNPLLQTQVRDGMRITVTRVVQRQECENAYLPYETQRQFTQALPPNEERVAQVGENGVMQVCYRIIEKDGVQTSRAEISRIPIKEPRNEIIYVGSKPLETLVPIEGVLTFISGGQAWIIQGNTANLTPLTEDSYLDGRVFDLSPDGHQLLYTRRTPDQSDPDFSNELWAILDTTASFPQPVQLVPEDVRFGQWVSGQQPYTFSYSTASPATEGAGWRAYNDLYLMQVNPETGETLTDGFEEIIPANALGSYAFWGRRFLWSLDGTQVAWANADGVGTVDLKTGEFDTLLSFPEYAPLLARFQGASVWTPT
ncbi:MAG TPA: G5 domain-containing protein, partial [Aggregatilineaceae bacterium]|nr:G5 domain-containing protein [Aggregatilineaceae bacterium]